MEIGYENDQWLKSTASAGSGTSMNANLKINNSRISMSCKK